MGVEGCPVGDSQASGRVAALSSPCKVKPERRSLRWVRIVGRNSARTAMSWLGWHRAPHLELTSSQLASTARRCMGDVG
eukprot:3957387-Pyramimonas_sp.AAC.1